MDVYEFAKQARARGAEVRIVDYPHDVPDQTGRRVRVDAVAVLLPPVVGRNADEPIPQALNEVPSAEADRVASISGVVDERDKTGARRRDPWRHTHNGKLGSDLIELYAEDEAGTEPRTRYFYRLCAQRPSWRQDIASGRIKFLERETDGDGLIV